MGQPINIGWYVYLLVVAPPLHTWVGQVLRPSWVWPTKCCPTLSWTARGLPWRDVATRLEGDFVG